MSNAITDFNYWLTRRWTTPFTLAFLLLAISAIAALNVLLIYYCIHPLTANSDMLKRIKIVAGISQCLHGLLAQVSLAWMVYRIYPWKIFRFILPVVISLIGLGIGVQVWASILSIPGKDARTPGSVMGLQLMASLIFFTGLFIYRYR
ncbi:hypothetical protein BKA69DRAFT_142987 [Paraphysoderma sedebokerense]|nr:hypothetical protein BKA69DRAFT_142987 [Paraphysoderma sedebokerense]